MQAQADASGGRRQPDRSLPAAKAANSRAGFRSALEWDGTTGHCRCKVACEATAQVEAPLHKWQHTYQNNAI